MAGVSRFSIVLLAVGSRGSREEGTVSECATISRIDGDAPGRVGVDHDPVGERGSGALGDRPKRIDDGIDVGVALPDVRLRRIDDLGDDRRLQEPDEPSRYWTERLDECLHTV